MLLNTYISDTILKHGLSGILSVNIICDGVGERDSTNTAITLLRDVALIHGAEAKQILHV